MVMKYNWIQKVKCMVMKMNKTGFINELLNKLAYSENELIIINIREKFLY